MWKAGYHQEAHAGLHLHGARRLFLFLVMQASGSAPWSMYRRLIKKKETAGGHLYTRLAQREDMLGQTIVFDTGL